MPARLVLFIFLILSVGMSAHSEKLPAPRDTTNIRSPLRYECEDLLTKNERIAKNDRKIKIRTAELLLMLIFEHPILLQAAENDSVSEKDLYTLFHFSSGFGIRPPKARNWHFGDANSYDRHIVRLTREQKSWDHISTSNDGYVSLQERLESARKEKLEPNYVEEIANSLFHILVHQIRTLSKKADTSYGALHTSEYKTTIWPNSLKGISDRQVRVSNFRALIDKDVLHFGLIAEDLEPGGKSSFVEANVRKNFVRFVSENLKDILRIRDQILVRGISKKSIRKALLEAEETRVQLRNRIMDGVYTDDSKKSYLSKKLMIPSTQEMNETAQTLMQKLEDSQTDSLDVSRDVLRQLDSILAIDPPTKIPDELAWLSSYEISNHIDDLALETEDLKMAASLRAEALDAMLVHFKPVIVATQKRLANYGHELQTKSYSELLAKTKLEEAELLQHALVQNLEILANNHPLQIKFLGQLNKLEALIRKHKHELSLDGDDYKTRAAIQKILEDIAANPKPIRSGGGGRMILL